VSHLHWGGGTPTVLEPHDLERVMEALRKRFRFAPGAELAIESDPRTLTDDMTARIGALGFTRASFGVQEFDPKVQAAIHRIQPPDVVGRAIEGLRAAGVKAINIDLIYGLPHQSVDSLTRTIATCLGMRPDRVALFGYAHVPWMAKKQRMIPEDALPGPEARAAQAQAAADALVGAGYQAVGLDHFARPDDALSLAARRGTLRRNFQGYTTDGAETLIALGATAIGRTPEGYVQSHSAIGAWTDAVVRGEFPVAKGHALSTDDKLRGHVIERIMCDGQVDLDAAGRRFAQPAGWYADALEELRDMADDGLLALDGGLLRLSERGRPLMRVVASVFDRYLRRSEKRHSLAI
jgi:oxygen-independent coproporphyrinogen-3 oxidase